MKRSVLLLPLLFLAPILAPSQTNPLVGRWDFDVPTPNGIGANWLGISEKDGKLDIWFQPTGGNVFQIKNYKIDGSHLTLTVSPGNATHRPQIWELDAKDGKLTGTQKRGNDTIALTGLPAPALNRQPPSAWSAPQALFDGKDLNGGNRWAIRLITTGSFRTVC